jgi:hypothetical protein
MDIIYSFGDTFYRQRTARDYETFPLESPNSNSKSAQGKTAQQYYLFPLQNKNNFLSVSAGVNNQVTLLIHNLNLISNCL